MEQSLVYICKLIIEMFLFSMLGWMIEVLLQFIQFKKFINRGYLIGPYCPIYGCGVVVITESVKYIKADASAAEIFLIGLIICGVWEYFISWCMEKLFHARWWDYSRRPMNLNGRIWIGNLIAFGIGSVIICKWATPGLFTVMAGWSDFAIIVFTVAIVILCSTDAVVSTKMMGEIRNEIDAREEDNTEEISLKVKELLKEKNFFIRRIRDAYPKFQAKPLHLTKQLKMAQKELKEASRKFKEELNYAAKYAKEENNVRLQEAKERLEKAREKLRNIKDRLNIHDWWREI